MLLYNGSKFVKGNVFEDPRGNKFTFYKNTKNGKLFTMENGIRVGLTESQVNKLKLLNEDTIAKKIEVPKIIGIDIKFDFCEEKFRILENSLKSFNIYIDSDNQNHFIGYVCFDMKNVTLGSFTLEFLKEYQKSGLVDVMFEDMTGEQYKTVWIYGIQNIQDDIYLFLFESKKE